MIAVRRWRNDPPRDWWDLAAQIPSQTLVLGGAKSYLPQPRLREISQRIPNATFTSLDRGHVIHEERPSEFLQVGRAVHLVVQEVGQLLIPVAWPGSTYPGRHVGLAHHAPPDR